MVIVTIIMLEAITDSAVTLNGCVINASNVQAATARLKPNKHIMALINYHQIIF